MKHFAGSSIKEIHEQQKVCIQGPDGGLIDLGEALKGICATHGNIDTCQWHLGLDMFFMACFGIPKLFAVSIGFFGPGIRTIFVEFQCMSVATFFSCMFFFSCALFLQVRGFFTVAAVSLLSSTIFHAPHTPMELVSLHHHSLCLFFLPSPRCPRIFHILQ